MQSIQLVAPRTLEPREMAMPRDPGPGEVLVRVRAVGVCGSDMHWYLEGGIGSYRSIYPQVLGHEPAGEIAGLGAGVTGLELGQRVALEPTITCGHCEFCMSGHHNNCVSAAFMSSPQLPGLLREYAVIPVRNAVPVPSDMSFTDATLVEPLAVVLHILELVDIHVADTVAILGAGPIGMLTAAVARMAGAARVFIADRLPHRLRLAVQMGADVTVNTTAESLLQAVMDQTCGRGVDIVFDAAGAVETINAGMRIARLGGRFVLIGLPVESKLPVDVHVAMAKELSIHTVKRSNHNAQAALRVLQSGRISKRLVTHCLPFAKTPWAFETLAAYAEGAGKIVIEIP